MIHIDNISHLQFDLRAAENEKTLKRRPPEHPRTLRPHLGRPTFKRSASNTWEIDVTTHISNPFLSFYFFNIPSTRLRLTLSFNYTRRLMLDDYAIIYHKKLPLSLRYKIGP